MWDRGRNLKAPGSSESNYSKIIGTTNTQSNFLSSRKIYSLNVLFIKHSSRSAKGSSSYNKVVAD